jgi:Rieske Fe-S protein
METPHDPAASTAAPPQAAPPRRRFFELLTYLLGAIAAALAGVPLVGYVVAPRKRRVQWVSLGPVEQFPTDQTRLVEFDNPLRQPWDGIVAHTGVYVRNEGKATAAAHHFLVLAVNCAHLGCPVSWFPESGLFMCPCHGGVYHADGERASGPPPRGLFHCVWRVKGGKLEIQAPHYPTLQDTLQQPA